MVQSLPSLSPDMSAQVDRALLAAQKVCEQKQSRLTVVRAAVLRIIARSNRPLGAYALLVLLENEVGRKHTPPTIYRALDFLLEMGLILRVESRNAYILRDYSDRPGPPVLFLCDTCDSSVAIESPDLAELIESNAATLKFHIARPVIECSGTCDRCAEVTADAGIRGNSNER